MSSSKYQPNSRKRPIDLVTPEFPSIPPVLSLEAAMKFAVKSQAALQSVTISTNIDYLFLPLISPHGLQQRFNVGDDNSVLVVMRKSYPSLKNELEILNRNHYGIYVRGPFGVGKSYLLYLLAAEYRLNRKEYRVTYINDCAAWRGLPYLYLLKEFVTTFYDDVIEEKSIVEWCQTVTGSEKEEKMIMIMESLIKYIHENNLVWIIICDQHNALYNPSVVKDFPFSLIDTLARNRQPNIKIVISASANNEGYPTEMKGWKTHDISSHRFDQDEFKVWCDQYLLEDMEVNHESEEAMDALFWSGGVPYELDLLWKQPKETLTEKTLLYRKERVKDMRESHGKFYKTLVDKEKDNLAECISRMALGLSPPQGLEGMDRQIFDIIDGEDGHEIITALNPVARCALLGYHDRGLMTSLGFVAEIVLRGTDYPNNIKVKISEMYITTMLELSLLFDFQFRKVANIAKIGLPDDIPPQRRTIEIKSVVHFLRNKLPPKTSFHKNQTTLFVPDSPNYPRFDFFIWDSERQLMMGFQVTVLNPFSDHSKMTNSQMWQRFCFGNSTQTPMELYWVVPKCCCIGADIASVVNDSIILFEDLISDFPALGKLKFAFPFIN